MRCKRFQCFTMCFSMFRKFVISEGGQTEMFYKCFSMFYGVFFLMFYGCATNALQTFSMFHHVFFDVS